MPQAVVIAGLGAAAGIGGAALQTRSVNRAADAQERARREALAYEKSKIAEDKANREKAAQAYRESWLQWANRAGEEGVRRYGVPVGISWPGASGGNHPPTPARIPANAAPEPAPQPTMTPAYGASAQAPTGSTLGDMMGAPAAPMASSTGYGAPAAPPMGMQAAGPVAPMVAPTGPTGPQAPRPGASIGDLSGWEDWRRYGVGGEA